MAGVCVAAFFLIAVGGYFLARYLNPSVALEPNNLYLANNVNLPINVVANESGLTKIQLRYKPLKAKDWQTTDSKLANPLVEKLVTNSFELSNLQKATTYEYQYQTTNEQGVSQDSWSAPLYFATAREVGSSPTNGMVALTKQANSDNPGDITFEGKAENATYYVWDFGDGMTSENLIDTANTHHIYATGGDYNVTLTAYKSISESDNPLDRQAKYSGQTIVAQRELKLFVNLPITPANPVTIDETVVNNGDILSLDNNKTSSSNVAKADQKQAVLGACSDKGYYLNVIAGTPQLTATGYLVNYSIGTNMPRSKVTVSCGTGAISENGCYYGNTQGGTTVGIGVYGEDTWCRERGWVQNQFWPWSKCYTCELSGRDSAYLPIKNYSGSEHSTYYCTSRGSGNCEKRKGSDGFSTLAACESSTFCKVPKWGCSGTHTGKCALSSSGTFTSETACENSDSCKVAENNPPEQGTKWACGTTSCIRQTTGLDSCNFATDCAAGSGGNNGGGSGGDSTPTTCKNSVWDLRDGKCQYVTNSCSSALDQCTCGISEINAKRNSGMEYTITAKTLTDSNAKYFKIKFGDSKENESSENKFTHTYTASGTYKVVVSSYPSQKDADAGKPCDTQILYLTTSTCDTGKLTASPYTGDATNGKVAVKFTNVGADKVNSYQFVYGDGVTSPKNADFNSIATYSYAGGSYLPTVEGFDSSGSSCGVAQLDKYINIGGQAASPSTGDNLTCSVGIVKLENANTDANQTTATSAKPYKVNVFVAVPTILASPVPATTDIPDTYQVIWGDGKIDERPESGKTITAGEGLPFSHEYKQANLNDATGYTVIVQAFRTDSKGQRVPCGSTANKVAITNANLDVNNKPVAKCDFKGKITMKPDKSTYNAGDEITFSADVSKNGDAKLPNKWTYRLIEDGNTRTFEGDPKDIKYAYQTNGTYTVSITGKYSDKDGINNCDGVASSSQFSIVKGEKAAVDTGKCSITGFKVDPMSTKAVATGFTASVTKLEGADNVQISWGDGTYEQRNVKDGKLETAFSVKYYATSGSRDVTLTAYKTNLGNICNSQTIKSVTVEDAAAPPNPTPTPTPTPTSTYSVTMNIVPVGGGSAVATPASGITSGKQSTISATAASGFQFNGFTCAGVSYPNSSALTINQNVICTASFSLLSGCAAGQTLCNGKCEAAGFTCVSDTSCTVGDIFATSPVTNNGSYTLESLPSEITFSIPAVGQADDYIWSISGGTSGTTGSTDSNTYTLGQSAFKKGLSYKISVKVLCNNSNGVYNEKSFAFSVNK